MGYASLSQPENQSRKSNGWSQVGWVFFLLVATALVYFGALAGDFVWDDVPLIVDAPDVKSLSAPLRFFDKPFWLQTALDKSYREQVGARVLYRPLVTLSFALDYRIWGLWAPGFHISNLIFHSAAIIFLLLLLAEGGIEQRKALIAAAVFAVHPCLVTSVAWISGRSDVMVTVFVLGACFSFIRTKGSHLGSFGFYCCFLAALFTKELAIVTPFLCCLLSLRWAKARWHLPLIVSSAAALASYGLVRFLAGIESPSVTGEAIVRGVHRLACYGGITILPVEMHLAHEHAGALFFCVLGFSLFGWFVYLVCRGGENAPRLFFALAWFVIAMLPSLGLLVGPAADTVFSGRYLYLACVGFIPLIVLVVLERLAKSSPRHYMVVGFCVIGIFAVTTSRRASLFSDGATLWSSELVRSGDSRLAAVNLLLALTRAGNFTEGLPLARRLCSRHKRDSLIWHARLSLAIQAGVALEVRETFSHLATIKTPSPASLVNMAAFELGHEGEARAVELCTRALSVVPSYAVALNTRAVAMRRLQRIDEAMTDLERCVSLSPHYGAAWTNLGLTLEHKGDNEKAEQALRRAVAVHGDSSPEPLINLADFLERQQRFDEAGDVFATIASQFVAYRNSALERRAVSLRKGEELR